MTDASESCRDDWRAIASQMIADATGRPVRVEALVDFSTSPVMSLTFRMVDGCEWEFRRTTRPSGKQHVSINALWQRLDLVCEALPSNTYWQIARPWSRRVPRVDVLSMHIHIRCLVMRLLVCARVVHVKQLGTFPAERFVVALPAFVHS
jgi:hypothetical protein